MQRSGSNKVGLSVLVFLLLCFHGRTQELIREVKLEKLDSSLFKVQYKINNSKFYEVKSVTLKIMRKRAGQVEEIFSAPVDPKIKPHNQTYTCYWKTGVSTLKEGDELQARISIDYRKPPQTEANKKAGINKPPRADAGPFMDIQLPLKQPLVLDGSRSLDPDGRIVSVQWKQIGGPQSLHLGTPDSLRTTITGELLPGNYAFELTVRDENGGTSSDRLALSIEPATDLHLVTAQPSRKKDSLVSAPQKNNVPSFKTAVKLKGGPSNALFNVLVPGLGHYAVSGGPYGRNKKPVVFAITALYAGSIGGALYYRSRYEQEYQTYQDMAQYREFQRDASGNIIGVRGASQAEATVHWNNARALRRNALILGGMGVGILGSDLVYTILKGLKNKRQWQKETGGVSRLIIQSDGTQLSAGVQIKF